MPAKAFWYLAFRALAGAFLLVLFARFWHFLATSPAVRCAGTLCGKNNGGVEWMLYMLAGVMLVNSILQFKWFSFILTDHSIAIDFGFLVQKSRVFRFDRIQDVEARRNALHMLLGLKTVAIWTASLDQSRGNARRPEGLIVLDAASADWLADFLIQYDRGRKDPGQNGLSAVAMAGRGRPGNLGALIGISSMLVLAVLAWGFWSGTGSRPSSGASTTLPTAPAEPAAAPASAVPASPTVAATPAHMSRQRADTLPAPQTYAANPEAKPEYYSIACAAPSAGSSQDVATCADMKWGLRCEREAEFMSNPTAESTRLVVANRSKQKLNFYWLDAQGYRVRFAVLAPGRKIGQQSRIGAYWLVTGEDDRCVGIFNADTARIAIF